MNAHTHDPQLVQILKETQRALQAEAAAVARGASVELDDGRLVRRTADGHRYRFRLTDVRLPPPVGPITARCGELRTRGTLDAIDGDVVTVTTNRQLGRRPGRTEISADVAFLTESLRARIHAIETSVIASPEETRILRIRQALGLTTIPIPETSIEVPESPDLNARQRRVVAAALSRDVTYVQGPPGTGKTNTIGAIVWVCATRGERVLVVAPTNVAVDHALTSVLKRVSPEELGSPDAILRVGPAVELTEEVERRIGARILAERAMPEGDRPSALRAIRERAVEPIERLGELMESPSPSSVSLLAWVAGAQEQVETLRNAVSCVTTIQAPGRPRTDRKARHRMFDDLTRRAFEGEMTTPELARVRSTLSALRAAVNDADRTLDILGDWLDAHERDLVSQARIVGATLAKALVTPAISDTHFDVVVLDEASMVSVPQVIVAADMASRRLVIVGDPRQLAPIAATRDAAAKKFLETDVYEQCGLVAALDERRDDTRMITLTRQYRMHPQIASPASRLTYRGKLTTDRSVRRRKALALPFLAPGSGRAAVISTSSLDACALKALGTHSRLNIPHAGASAAVVAHLLAAGYGDDEIAVVTPHAAHARLLRSFVRDVGFDDVLIGTVHRVQGAQRRAVVLDLADAPPFKVSQLLRPTIYNPEDRVRRLLNVAITRAEETLLVVANWAFLKNGCPPRSPLARLFGERGFGAPFTDAADLMRSSTISSRLDVTLHTKHVPTSDRPTLLVNEIDTLGLLRVLGGLSSGVRIVYRAEGDIGRRNAEAIDVALDGDTREVSALGVDTVLSDTLVDTDSITSFGAPPWHSEAVKSTAVTIRSGGLVEELERSLRLSGLRAFHGRGLLRCRGCKAPLVFGVKRDSLIRKCGCRLPEPGAPSGREVRAESCV